MNRIRQQGVALIMALILLMVLSVMAVSLMFLSQTETWASMNYRLMSQARDVAEAGVNKAANFLLFSYTPPATGGSDPLTGYTLNAAPINYNGYSVTVTYGGSPVILSSNSSVASNYPSSAVQSNFHSAAAGSLAAGHTSINYTAYATLLSMRQVSVYGSSTPSTIQTWLITSDATINGVPNAQVEVSAIMEREVSPTFNYAAFADSSGCSALQFGGGGTTNSYDSSTVVGGVVTTQNYGGNVGTNGNLTTSGNPTTIYGSLSTPRTGVGTCSTSNVTAWSGNQGSVTGGVVELPQPVTYPTPDLPNPMPPTTNVVLNNGNCSGITNCTGNNGVYHFNPGTAAAPTTFGNVQINGSAVLHLCPGYYNINSIIESGQGMIVVDSGALLCPSSPPGSTQVVLNIAGTGVTGTVLNLTGGGISNPSLVPSNLQFLYAGSHAIQLKGGAAASALLYAPNASYSFAGGGDWYGAVIGQTLTDMGGAAIHYDRRLQNFTFIVGNYFLSSFTWKKY